jgi:hypothetical protein
VQLSDTLGRLTLETACEARWQGQLADGKGPGGAGPAYQNRIRYQLQRHATAAAGPGPRQLEWYLTA